MTGAMELKEVAQLDSRFAAMERRLEGCHPAWAQELVITAYNDARLSFVRSEMFAESETGGEAPEGLLPFTVEAARARSEAGHRSPMLHRLKLRASVLAARIGAVLLLFVLVLRMRGWPRLGRQNARTVLALHSEKANRTGHVRKALAGRDPDSLDVVFVGRTHLDAAGAADMLREAGWKGDFALGWDWRAAPGGLPEGLRIARAAWPAIAAAGYYPGFKSLMGINLRILIGAATAWRWRQGARSAEALVLAHTGRADTVLLELAARESGAKTVHWMHGLSDGRAYQGLSDLCVTLCEHDRRWHEQALHYQRNIAFPNAKPAFRMGSKPGCVVMTNLTHPRYTPFSQVGPAHELALVDMVRDWTKLESFDPAQVIWKPHPVFYQQDSETRALVSAKLDEAGFTLWPRPAMPFAEAAEYDKLVVTPSGIAIDMLQQGRMPVMAVLAPIEPCHVLDCFPVRAHDPKELQAGLATVADEAQARELFDATWDRIGPGEFGDLERIEAALR